MTDIAIKNDERGSDFGGRDDGSPKVVRRWMKRQIAHILIDAHGELDNWYKEAGGSGSPSHEFVNLIALSEFFVFGVSEYRDIIFHDLAKKINYTNPQSLVFAIRCQIEMFKNVKVPEYHIVYRLRYQIGAIIVIITEQISRCNKLFLI